MSRSVAACLLACRGPIWDDADVGEHARVLAGEAGAGVPQSARLLPGQAARLPDRDTDAMPRQGARWRWGPVAVAAAVTLTVLGVLAFAFGGPAAAPPGRAPGTAVVVASFNFPESELLAAIYALALMQAGIPARLQLGLGPRELVLPALAQGVVDVVPEYLGTALASLQPLAGVAVSGPAAVRLELVRALDGWPVEVLQPAAAQDQDGLAVTRATADRLRLCTVSDLGPFAPQMVLGGPPEYPQRPAGLPGLRRVYGLEFARFAPLDTEHERVEALRQGAADVVVMGTASGYFTGGDLVLLADDCQLQPAGHIVPLVHAGAAARYGPRLAAALDAVSARLSTSDLTDLNRQITIPGHTVLAEARAWLERQHILPQPG
jgi:osmoprotectant transport system substrate-binding protein